MSKEFSITAMWLVLILVGLSGPSAHSSTAFAAALPTVPTMPRYDARENGLKCDGVTDDTAPFNSLIAKVSSAGGGKIVFPRATCIVTSLNLANNVSIHGQGPEITTIKLKSHTGEYEAIFGTNKIAFRNVSFADLTIDQNTSGNPMTAGILLGKPRFVIATGAGSSKLSIERVNFKDLGNINTIYSASEFTRVKDSEFALNCDGSVSHDHSTVYVAGKHSQTRNNTFKGCVNAAGSVTAIETHGGDQTAVGNRIDGFWIGMNITGVASTDSTDVSVTDNTIKGAYYGIQMWSNRYRSHNSGYGLHGVTIKSNEIRLTQTAWTKNPVTGGANVGNPSGIWINATANLPLADITIQSNSIEYDLEAASSEPYNPSGMGIGYWDSTNVNSITGLKLLSNTIKNANANAVRVSANGSDLDICGNIVINPGSSANSGLSAGYRNGIFIASTTALARVRVNDNTITDTQPTSRIARGIYLAVAPGSQLSAVRNHFAITGSNINSLLGFIDSSSDMQSPLVQALVESPHITPSLLPARKVTSGSTFTDVTRGYVYQLSPDNRTWSPVANRR
jgi:hypothetical protein